MLEVTIKPHRRYLLANNPNQKLFLAVELRPKAEAISARSQLSVVFVVDTSGSMREVVTEPEGSTGKTFTTDGNTYDEVYGAKSKMDILIEGLEDFLNSSMLHPDDRLSLVKFDDSAEVILPFTKVGNKSVLMEAANNLYKYSGGTYMGAGIDKAIKLLEKETGNRRMVLLTDGNTMDEDLVIEASKELAKNNIPVTAIGIGNDWNEDLIIAITDRTQGKPFHVVPDTEDAQAPSIKASELSKTLLSELKHAINEVVTNISLNINTVKDIKLNRITRVYPTQTEVDLSIKPHSLGNAEAKDSTVFVLEFTLPERPPVRARMAQLSLTYDVPGANYKGETPPMDILVEFTTDEAMSASIDQEVMNRVQQRNVDALLNQAVIKSKSNPEEAQKTLNIARQITIELGNSSMTQVIDKTIDELQTGKAINTGTIKTLKIGAKTQTVNKNLPSDEEIRKIITGA